MTPTHRTWPRWLARGVVALMIAGCVTQTLLVFAGANWHAVIPGRVYRSSQPSSKGLRQQIADHNIGTIINLRGPSLAPAATWYTDELAAAHDAGISQEDFTLSASLPPPPAELRRLVEVLDRTDYPVLVHCKQGADRTGLVAALALILYTDSSLSAARRQLWPHYGHVSLGKTAAMDRFFDQYEAWLAGQADAHTPVRFRQWVLHDYRPEAAASSLTWLDPAPVSLPAGRAATLRLRAVNRSAETWELKPGDLAGIHLLYTLSGPNGRLTRDRAGLVRRSVPPGGAYDFALVIPPVPAGRYVLTAELLDARGAGVPIRASSFVKMGDEAAQAVLDVH